MYEITATHAKTGIPFTIDLDTASLAQLADVANPGRLPDAHKRKYFARKQQLEKQGRISLVQAHQERLKRIMESLLKRAVGPEDDEVHKALHAKQLELITILNEWLVKAEGNAKGFDELTLVNQLRGPLQGLKASLTENISGSDEHMKSLNRARNQVGDALSRAESGIRAFVKGASISYRGSLATGWRNAKKSSGGVAQRINLLQFDSDAFVEIPAATWEQWRQLGIVTEMQSKGKMDLSELITRANSAKNAGGQPAEKTAASKRVHEQLLGIEEVEKRIRAAMWTVKGYKKEESQADFSFVLQSSEKTKRELKSGNLYPLEEIEKAGLPLTEADLDVIYEEGVLKVKMPERHVRMSDGVPEKTYGWVPDSVPHTTERPTEAMLIKAYFEAGKQLRHVEQPIPRPLTDHLNAIVDLLIG